MARLDFPNVPLVFKTSDLKEVPLPGPGFTPGTGELDIFIHSSTAVGTICLDIFPIMGCVSGMCYADVCLLGATLRQRISH